eukprot:scaffold33824_cov84-Isochrysis_galbana.AAC.2
MFTIVTAPCFHRDTAAAATTACTLCRSAAAAARMQWPTGHSPRPGRHPLLTPAEHAELMPTPAFEGEEGSQVTPHTRALKPLPHTTRVPPTVPPSGIIRL